MSRSKQPQLSTVEPEPLNRYEQFRRQHGLSYRDLAKLLLMHKSTAHRMCIGERANPEFVRHRAEVEPRLRDFLAKRLLSPEAVRATINNLFDSPQEETMPIPRCDLSKACIKHFKLQADPFALDLESSEEYFVPPALQKVIDQAMRSVMQRRFLALIGGVGSGKTALRHHLMSTFAGSDKVRFVWIETANFEAFTFVELVWFILAELGEKPANVRIERVRQLGRVLSALSRSGVCVSLAIEEAHRLSDKALSTLKMFWEKGEVNEAAQTYNRFLGVLLFGQPRLEERLKSHQFEEVVQRLQVLKMPEFTKQAKDYLAHRLNAVGGKLDELFEPEALTHIAKRTNTPLALGNLANAALMTAFELGEAKVQAGMLTAENEPQIRGMRARA